MLQKRLLEKGVAQSAIDIFADETAAVNHALGMASEGDLVMIFGDDITRTWKQIISFEVEPGNVGNPGDNKGAQSFVEEDPKAFSLEDGEELIRDDRGVRIARNDEEGD